MQVRGGGEVGMLIPLPSPSHPRAPCTGPARPAGPDLPLTPKAKDGGAPFLLEPKSISTC